MNYVLLTRDSLDIGSITELASAETCAATSMFVGTSGCGGVKGRKLLSLEYDACESVAEKEMENICGELRFRWSDIVNIVIYHRIGLVTLGQASFVIAISSPNRKSAIDAVAATIEELQKRVSIWKKETYEEAEHATWQESRVSDGTGEPFDETMCCIQDPYPLSTKFVQISATENEIVRRIDSFIQRKREEIDLNNIVDYINPNYDKIKAEENQDDSHTSCARINGTIIKQENSKCHLKVRQIDNKMGPQVQHDYLYALDNLMETQAEQKAVKQDHFHESIQPSTKSALLQRADNIEEHLGIKDHNKKNIHQRLKYLEDRILFLESISPEYHHNLFDKPHASHVTPASEHYSGHSKQKQIKTCHRKVFSVADISQIIEKESQGGLN